MSNLGTHLLEGKIWNRIGFIQIDRHYRIASVVLNWGRVYNLFGRLGLGNAMGKIEETYCGKSDAAPLLWLAPIDWKQRSKIQKLWRFRVLTVTGGLIGQSWWITWVAFVHWGRRLRVQIAWFKSGRNYGSCLTSTLNISEGQGGAKI